MSQTPVLPRPQWRLTGWRVLAMVVAFFGVVTAVDVGFAVLAYRSFSGQVANDPYEAGLLYNRTLAQRRREAALGWTATVEAGGGGVRVQVLDRAGEPIPGLVLDGGLERPATEAGRQTLRFTRSAGGWFVAPARLEGAWDLRAAARGPAGERFEVEHRFVSP